MKNPKNATTQIRYTATLFQCKLSYDTFW